MSKIERIRKKFGMYEGVDGRVKEIGAETENTVESCIEDFEHTPSCYNRREFDKTKERIRELTAGAVFTPTEICDVIEGIRKTYSCFEMKEYSTLAGLYISALIQNSYDAGFNDFSINTSATKNLLNFLAADLKGTKYRPLHIELDLHAGRSIGYSSENCIFDIKVRSRFKENHMRGYGAEAKNCIFNLEGDIKESRIGAESEDCIFNIHGDIEDGCGYRAKRSVFNLYGGFAQFFADEAEECVFNFESTEFNSVQRIFQVGRVKMPVICSPYKCEFRTPFRKVADKLVQEVPSVIRYKGIGGRMKSENKIVLVTPRREEVIKHYVKN